MMVIATVSQRKHTVRLRTPEKIYSIKPKKIYSFIKYSLLKDLAKLTYLIV